MMNAINAFIMSFEGMIANPSAFTGKVHEIRNHEGQIAVARLIRNAIREVQLSEQHSYHISKQRLQDSYSFRCVSQILGISFEMFDKLKDVLNKEINKVSTVPLVFGAEDVLFAGNFSDFNLISVLDMMNICINEIGTLSDVNICIYTIRLKIIFLFKNRGESIGLIIHSYFGEEKKVIV